MTEPVDAFEPRADDAVENPAASTSVSTFGDIRSTGIENARSACLALSVFGAWACWGFAVLGILCGAVPLVELAGGEPADNARWVGAGLQALFAVLAFALAGWGASALTRLTATAILDYLERMARISDDLSIRASAAVALLERIAESLVGEVSSLKEDVAKSRHAMIKSGLDQLEAARVVKDADRVLEIYQSLVPSLDQERRATLDRDLAKWFLTLIHRRLRTGKVQADVVQLAARFAENFAATVEGASVLASLPTLRRSVGLCPRCAQPYTGVADACPNCKKSAMPAQAMPPPDATTDQAE